MNQETKPAGTGGRTEEELLRWSELPRLLQAILERTPRGQWYRIRPILAISPETHRILDLANLVEQVLPRSSLGLRRRGLSLDERTRKAHELIQSFDEFWAGVDGLERVLEKIARSCGLWSYFESKKNPARAGAASRPPRTPERPKAPPPPPPKKPTEEPEALPEAVFEVEGGEEDRESGGEA
jgi:hypothetical protein